MWRERLYFLCMPCFSASASRVLFYFLVCRDNRFFLWLFWLVFVWLHEQMISEHIQSLLSCLSKCLTTLSSHEWKLIIKIFHQACKSCIACWRDFFNILYFTIYFYTYCLEYLCFYFWWTWYYFCKIEGCGEFLFFSSLRDFCWYFVCPRFFSVL